MDKISVIIPVYNAEKFLNKCINSVLNQKYDNIELILINDGSKDGSLDIIRKYQKENKKTIKVIDQKNQGEGVARNNGMDIATGKYLVFLDSDDWLKEDYLITLHDAIQDNDIVISGFERYNKDYGFEYSKQPDDNYWSKFKYCSVAGKMYRTKFINDNNLRYKKYRIGEDVYFSLNAYSYTNKIKIALYSGYCNYENISSLTNSKEYNPEKSLMIVLKDVEKYINTDKFNIKDMTFFYLKNIVVELILNKDYLSSKELNQKFIENMDWLKNVLKSKKLKLKTIHNKYETKKINLAVNLFILAYKTKSSRSLISLIKRMELNLI